MLDYLKNIIKEICDEKNINYTLLSRDWIVKLEKNNKIGYLVGSKFSINPVTASMIASDKYATYEVLKNKNLPIIEHQMIFNPKYRSGFISDLNSKKDLENYLKNQASRKVVVKANDGSCGTDVYLCKNTHEIYKTIKKLFKEKPSLSICPFYDIDTEYRVICLDGECKLIYGKKAMNGNWKHNLSQGAAAIHVEDEDLKSKLKEIAIKATNEIGLRFASVDIIKLITGELLIIEVNLGVTINKYTEFVTNGRDIAKSIYGEVIEKMLV